MSCDPNTIYATPRLISPGLVYCKSSALDHVTTKSGLVASGQKAFRNLLHELWFTLYSRGNRKVGSSAFEHVFLGELKRGEVSGMHNWIYFSHEESLKHANYMGWIKKLDFGTVPNTYTTCVKVPNTSTTCVKVPNTYTTCVKVSNTSSTCVKVPNTSTTCVKVPNTSTTCVKVPNTSTTCVKVPNTPPHVARSLTLHHMCQGP
uniref:EndoU domain-containing protein n=1 Tax=Timema douglasi TaxID=61478 RepID=A0A7R8VR39_TIMDO|nr:unnamed protein product [Timema douglasi]